MERLPIDALLPDVIESLQRAPNLVIEAPPGAGKTTRVPRAMLDAGFARDGEIWILEPRRLAARMAARRVAEELNERLGETVGYQVRFDEISSPRTRLRFVTEGVLTRRLLADPQLSKISAIILDEFHERHLQTDLALALLRRLQLASRPELRIVAMSATLDAEPLARFLSCRALRSEGRMFPVAIEHAKEHDARPLNEQVASAIAKLVRENLDGDVLVFLPGAAEIRRAQSACAEIAASHDLLLLPLHGELSSEEQDRAVRPADKRKVILSTNVAESSLTIEGVVAVVDSGLARIAGHSAWSGLTTLSVARISRASCAQRAGRAGRTQPGRCLRLYAAQDFNARPEHDLPEIERLDLTEAALELHASGVRDLYNFSWFEPPQPQQIEVAETLLARLGALDAEARITETGKRMLRFPLHPRLARIVVEAEARGCVEAGCTIAALIAERDIRASNLFDNDRRERSAAHARKTPNSPSDLLDLLELFSEAERADFNQDALRRLNLNPSATHLVARVKRNLLRQILTTKRMRRADSMRETSAREHVFSSNENNFSSNEKIVSSLEHELSSRKGDVSFNEHSVSLLENNLLISILTGFPDRVARRRKIVDESRDDAPQRIELQMSNGASAKLSNESVVRAAQFLVAVEAEGRGGAGAGRSGEKPIVRVASKIEPDWLLELYFERITETIDVRWNKEAQRVEVVRRMLYDEIVLDESRISAEGSREVSDALAAQALTAGIAAFADAEEIERLLARVDFMRRTFPEDNFPALGDEDVRAALKQLCEGRSGFDELRDAARAGELMEILRRKLSPEQRRALQTHAPERLTLKRGRQVRIRYERGAQPYAASRLQDFYGMTDAPRIANGRAALLLHLLAPNNRPVQITQDLAGFWSRHYPALRRELSRRYPRHQWLENPLEDAIR